MSRDWAALDLTRQSERELSRYLGSVDEDYVFGVNRMASWEVPVDETSLIHSQSGNQTSSSTFSDEWVEQLRRTFRRFGSVTGRISSRRASAEYNRYRTFTLDSVAGSGWVDYNRAKKVCHCQTDVQRVIGCLCRFRLKSLSSPTV